MLLVPEIMLLVVKIMTPVPGPVMVTSMVFAPFAKLPVVVGLIVPEDTVRLFDPV